MLLIISFIPVPSQAKNIKLLELPSGDGSSMTYSVNADHECSFKEVSQVIISNLSQSEGKNFLLDKLNFYQRKINLELEREEITPDKIIISLKGSKNLTFEFSYNKPECTLKRVLNLNKNKYNIDEIDVEYSNALKSPVLEKIRIKDEDSDNSDLLIYPWALRGQIPSYEFSFGPAVNVHSNIRLRNKKLFEKNDPVIEPIPAFLFRYGPFFLNKNGMGSLVFHQKDFTVLAMGVSEGEPYETDGLSKKDKGIFLGSILKYKILELTYYNDFLEDRGYNLKANLAPEFYFDLDWKFSPQLYVQYWDRDYVNFYFGVRPHETGTGFPVYETKHTINYGTLFEMIHFVDKWTYVMDVGMKFYGKEVHNSPTVVRKNEVRFIASVIYKFF